MKGSETEATVFCVRRRPERGQGSRCLGRIQGTGIPAAYSGRHERTGSLRQLISDNYFCRRIASPVLLPRVRCCLTKFATEGQRRKEVQWARKSVGRHGWR
jgi:hypothetical protein